jgi:hypothetical protein
LWRAGWTEGLKSGDKSPHSKEGLLASGFERRYRISGRRSPLAYTSATLCVMSGTGNTLRVARWMAESIEAQGTLVEIRRIEEGDARELPGRGDDHLVGLLSPTHAFTAAWPMIWLACRLPRGKGTHAFVTLTRAGTKFGPFRFPGL